MDPVSIALLVGQLLLKYGPDVAREFQLLFSGKPITQEDWDRIFTLAKQPWQDRKPA